MFPKAMADEVLATPDRHVAVGLDIGGTKTAAGLLSLPSGRLLARRTIPTRPGRPGGELLADIRELAEGLLAEGAGLGLETVGIGIGVAELVDLGGVVASEYMIPWRGLSLEAELGSLASVAVDSDVRAAARAEATLGAGAQFDPLAYLTVGTGIGLALVQGRRPYTGARGSAGTFGFTPLSTVCTRCGDRLERAVVDLASGPALVARYNERRPGGAARGEDVLAAAECDPAAGEIVDSAAHALGAALGFIVDLLDPEAIVVGGGLGLAGGRYWEGLLAATRSHVWSETNAGLPILPAAFGPDAGVVGAALTAWERR
jgi:glucokinase